MPSCRADARIEKLADGFLFTEGPIWVPEGYLLFSDPNANTIYRWSDDGRAVGLSNEERLHRIRHRRIRPARFEWPESGSGGPLDDRPTWQPARRSLEKTGAVTVLADRFEGKRLNSPNDLVYKSDGSLYFTDPPFGLPKFFDDPRKELPFSGVFRWADGRLQLVSKDLTGPNGIAFSPDEKYLYVGDWDEKKKVVMRYEVNPDGSLSKGTVFFDMTSAPGEDAIDGLKVDQRGNVYVSGPGGLWILSAEGQHLGTIAPPEHPHNFAWGDADGKTLYLTAQSGPLSHPAEDRRRGTMAEAVRVRGWGARVTCVARAKPRARSRDRARTHRAHG